MFIVSFTFIIQGLFEMSLHHPAWQLHTCSVTVRVQHEEYCFTKCCTCDTTYRFRLILLCLTCFVSHINIMKGNVARSERGMLLQIPRIQYMSLNAHILSSDGDYCCKNRTNNHNNILDNSHHKYHTKYEHTIWALVESYWVYQYMIIYLYSHHMIIIVHSTSITNMMCTILNDMYLKTIF